MKREIAYIGPKFSLEYAVTAGGSCPGRQFYSSLEPDEQRKVMALFIRMGDVGRIPSREQFKKVEGTDYFEFKSFQVRFLCRFRPGQILVLIHGFRKKKDRIPPAEIERADRIFAEHIAERE